MTVTLVVMGVSGVGKSTVARELSARTGWVFAEGDDLHPEGNRATLAAGHPAGEHDDRGHTHPHVVRILARAWISVIWRWQRDHTSYEPARHRALQALLDDPATAAA